MFFVNNAKVTISLGEYSFMRDQVREFKDKLTKVEEERDELLKVALNNARTYTSETTGEKYLVIDTYKLKEHIKNKYPKRYKDALSVAPEINGEGVKE